MPVRAGLREAISGVYGAIAPDNMLMHAGAEETISTLMNDVPSSGEEASVGS